MWTSFPECWALPALTSHLGPLTATPERVVGVGPGQLRKTTCPHTHAARTAPRLVFSKGVEWSPGGRVEDAGTSSVGGPTGPRVRTARATTPIDANVIQAWGAHSGDPDTQHLCNWLDNGAPLGYAQSIPSVGVFPKVESKTSTAQLQQDLHRLAELRLSRTRSARSGHAGCRLHRKGFLPHRQLHGRSHSRAWRTARAEQVRPHREGEPTRHQEVPADMGPPGIASQLHMLPRGTHPVAKTVGPGPTSSPTISTGQ